VLSRTVGPLFEPALGASIESTPHLPLTPASRVRRPVTFLRLAFPSTFASVQAAWSRGRRSGPVLAQAPSRSTVGLSNICTKETVNVCTEL
jgi:hypothetical protein